MNAHSNRTAVLDLEPAKADFLSEALDGLSRRPRSLPCKYFYDATGAALFQQICELPEYYPTRAELEILDTYSTEISRLLGSGVELIGLGTGAGTKTRLLVENLDRPVAYIPVDISKEQLEESTLWFRERFAELEILPVCADYLEPFDLPSPERKPARKVVYFPGSTIGNFETQAARNFLRRITSYCGKHGGLLIGVDLQKERRVLERAYNDSAGVTAQFNLNLLVRANRDLDADFDIDHWRHSAVYNAREGRIEIYLVSTTHQTVHIQDREFHFEAGEKILTEYSYKYTPEGFAALARSAGFEFQKMWTDKSRLFGVFYFTTL
jgi:L-histidine Nalpha-methyltransferase